VIHPRRRRSGPSISAATSSSRRSLWPKEIPALRPARHPLLPARVTAFKAQLAGILRASRTQLRVMSRWSRSSASCDWRANTREVARDLGSGGWRSITSSRSAS
jgi:hypothetical protein